MTYEEAIRILCDNVQEFAGRQALAKKQRELAVALVCDRLLSEHGKISPQRLYKQFHLLLPDASPSDQVIACKRITARKKTSPYDPLSLFDAEDSVAAGSHGRIALVRNRYNEQAFDRFSTIITGAKASYPASFTDACEDVMDNRCEFCILPIENPKDGRLFGFYAMMDRYELKLCASCQIENDTSAGYVRYALVGKSLPDRLPKSAPQQLEFSVAEPIGTFPKDILEVAEQLQAQPIKVDTIPVQYDDGLQRFFFTFRLSEDAAQAFHLYLTSEHTAYTPIGFYTALS